MYDLKPRGRCAGVFLVGGLSSCPALLLPCPAAVLPALHLHLHLHLTFPTCTLLFLAAPAQASALSVITDPIKAATVAQGQHSLAHLLEQYADEGRWGGGWGMLCVRG